LPPLKPMQMVAAPAANPQDLYLDLLKRRQGAA
jgi:hypothetical protein